MPSVAAREKQEVKRDRLEWLCNDQIMSLSGVFVFSMDPLSYFLFHPVLYDWCNKGHGMCNPVCGIVHIKEPLL